MPKNLFGLTFLGIVLLGRGIVSAGALPHPAFPSARLLATIGKKGSGPGEFSSPGALALDERRTLYVADVGNNRIQVFDSTGAYLREIPGEGLFQTLSGLALSGTSSLLVSDVAGRAIVRLDRYGVPLGDFYKPTETLFLPRALTVARSGEVLVCEKGSHRIRVLSPGGSLLRSFGGFGKGLGNLLDPAGVTIRNRDQALWVVEQGNARVQAFNIWGESQGILGAGMLKAPSSVTLDSQGRLWIADAGNDRVLALSPAGETVGEIPGLARPEVVLSSGDRLYISEAGNHRVLIYAVDAP